MTVILMGICAVRLDWAGCLAVVAAAAVSVGLSLLIRRMGMVVGRIRSKR